MVTDWFLLPRCLKIRGIATPARALVRNDRAFSNSPFAFYHGVDLAVYFQTPYIIPRTTSPYRMKLWGFLRFERNAHKPFSICGYSFQNGLGFQRDGRSLGSGFQRRRCCLGGRNPMKPAVSWHTTLPAKSSVLYLWRPWVAERGCSGREQALSVSHRTGGFWRATR